MIRALSAYVFLLSTFLFATSCSRPTNENALTLFAAASLSDVIQELGRAFEETTAHRLYYNFASSGALTQQLIAGAEADLFLSASSHWMQALQAQVTDLSPQALLSNQLVVIAHKESPYTFSKSSLTDEPFKYLAIGDPAHVPVGTYAKSWLESAGLWADHSSKISPCPDARSTLNQVAHNRDVIGIVYRTDYLAHKTELKLLYEVPFDESSAIEYTIALLNKDSEVAQDFLKYLQSSEAQTIFQKHGFLTPHSK